MKQVESWLLQQCGWSEKPTASHVSSVHLCHCNTIHESSCSKRIHHFAQASMLSAARSPEWVTGNLTLATWSYALGLSMRPV